MTLPNRGILYVADSNVIPELLLSVWTARKTNANTQISVVAVDLPSNVLDYLTSLHITIVEPKCQSLKHKFAIKKEAYIHHLYDTTLFVDADTIFLQHLDDALWEVPPGAIKIHSRTNHYYTARQFLKIHKSRALCGYHDPLSLTEKDYCAFNSGVFLYSKEVQPILEGFFMTIPDETWDVALAKSLGADQGLLQYLCLSRSIPVIELRYTYNFEEHYHNHKKFYTESVDTTLRHAFTAAITLKKAAILHHHAYMWLNEIPKAVIKKATLRTIVSMLKESYLFNIAVLESDLQTLLPNYSEIFEQQLPVLMNPYEQRIPKMLHRIAKKLIV